jgi:hypothetical protein
MKIIKKILHSLFSVFLIWQTIMFVDKLLVNQVSNYPGRFIDAILINLLVIGIITIVHSFPAHKLLPLEYYKIKNPQLLKICGQIMQIDLYKKLLILTIWNRKQNKKYFFNGYRNGFDNMIISSMTSEFGHLIGFCIVMILTIIIGIKASYSLAIMILFVNLFFNFYPFMLQRFHRLRLDELRNRFRDKKA